MAVTAVPQVKERQASEGRGSEVEAAVVAATSAALAAEAREEERTVGTEAARVEMTGIGAVLKVDWVMDTQVDKGAPMVVGQMEERAVVATAAEEATGRVAMAVMMAVGWTGEVREV